ncbi:MAG TPA: hypothetical protein VF384_12110 [Planctomycetota bacterium]
MRASVASCLCACFVAVPIRAQGVLPLSETLVFGEISTTFAGACGPSAFPTIAGDQGLATFWPNGTCTVQSQGYTVCPGGLVVTGAPESRSATYEVGSDGTMTMRWLPAQPGVDDDVVLLRADGAVMVRARFHDRSSEPQLMIAVALSSGHGLGSLQGPYHVTRLVQDNAVTGLVAQGELGVIQFDGHGGYQESGVRHELPMGGTGSTTNYGPRVGSYAVAPDGSLTTGVGAVGALSPDGEVFFWIRRSGSVVSLTIGLRQATAFPAAMARGDWRLAAIASAIGATAPSPELRSDWGLATLDPNLAGGGALALDLVHVVSTPAQTTAAPSTVTDTFTIGSQGQLVLRSSATPSMPGALSADSSVFAALTIPGDSIGLAVGVAAAHWPAPYGAPTAGSGGIAPLLLAVGGFPFAGNPAFALVVAGGRGGALGLLVASGDVASGLPLYGGHVWIDPNQVFASQPLVLSGPAGVAGGGAAALPLPLPQSAALWGFSFACQAFTHDPAAPQAIAMSSALEIEICR